MRIRQCLTRISNIVYCIRTRATEYTGWARKSVSLSNSFFSKMVQATKLKLSQLNLRRAAAPPPSNSAHWPCSDAVNGIQKTERAPKIIAWSFFRSGQWSFHQMSKKVKFWRFQHFSTNRHKPPEPEELQSWEKAHSIALLPFFRQ